MRIIGFDPANYKNLGWSLVETQEKNGKTDKISVNSGTFIFTEDGYECLLPMHKKISALISKHKPDVVIFEYTPFGKMFVAGQISQGVGVLLLSCLQKGIEVKKTSPSHVKKVISGNSKATKVQMIKATKKIMSEWGFNGYEFDSHHACDATASCFCLLADKEIITISETENHVKKKSK